MKAVTRGTQLGRLVAVGAGLNLGGLAVAFLQLPLGFAILVYVGVALSVAGGGLYIMQRPRFSLEPRSEGESVFVVVHNDGCASLFEAQVIDFLLIDGDQPPHQRTWYVRWEDELERQCLIMPKMKNALSLAWAAGPNPPDAPGPFLGTFDLHRPFGKSALQVAIASDPGYDRYSASEIQVRLRVTRVTPNRTIDVRYSLKLEKPQGLSVVPVIRSLPV
jgi:hypothetical protein